MFSTSGLGLWALALATAGPSRGLLGLAGLGLVAGGVLCLLRRTGSGLIVLGLGLALALAAGVTSGVGRRDLAAPVVLSLAGLWLIWAQRRPEPTPPAPPAEQDAPDGR